MLRPVAASAALLLALLHPAAAGAQAAPAPAETPRPAKPGEAAAKPSETAPAKPPSLSANPAPESGAQQGPPLDAATRELVRREVEKAKEEMRDELRAEIQGAQSAREFMETGAAGERTKLEFLQLNGYMRVRGDLLDNLDLHRAADVNGTPLFPAQLINPAHRGTITSGNMRFRLEPTLNPSEQIRVHAQLDLLDDLVLGQTPNASGITILNTTQAPPERGLNSDRSSLLVKRAWAEVQTPVGLLSFGRMPSSWGMGILSHAGNGIDDDFGDSVDRLQFALMPLKTPLGSLVLVPSYEIVATGITTALVPPGSGLGQPFDRDQRDDARALGLKVVHEDTAEEAKRKLEQNRVSASYGAWYQYKTQEYEFPSATFGNPGLAVHRNASAHVLDLWARRESRRFKLEIEVAGVLGQIDDASNNATPIGPVLLRQFGGVVNAGWKLAGGKLLVGGELGLASGDRDPGFGNQPGRAARACGTDPISGGTSCPFDQAQFISGERVLDIRNFRFNPAYRVDLILFREILQGVTDAWYLKPTIRYELLEGLAAQLSVIYSQAMYASSTPSVIHSPLGLEADAGLSYQSDDGFIAYLNYGLLQPLDGLKYQNANGHENLTRGHAIRAGLAVKF
jgi:uncharacterized protein (TIGR04551 family)